MKKAIIILASLLWVMALDVHPSLAEVGENQAMPPLPAGTVNCFDYYKFGSVALNFFTNGTKSWFLPQEKITFKGTLLNKNEFPLVDGTLFVRIGKKNIKKMSQGNFIIDELVPLKNISLAPNQPKDVSFDWSVPDGISAGDYEADFYFLTGKEFSVSGLDFSSDIVGSSAFFNVKSDVEKDALSFDLDNAKVNDKPFSFVGNFIIKQGENIAIQQPIKNNSDKNLVIILQKEIYRWGSLNPENFSKGDSEIIIVPAGKTYLARVFMENPISSASYVRFTATYNGNSKLISDFRVLSDQPFPRVSFPGLTKFPLKAGDSSTLFACFHNGSMSSTKGTITATLADKSGATIAKAAYNGDIPDSVSAVKQDFKAGKNYDWLKMTVETNDEKGQTVQKYEAIYDCNAIDPESCAKAGESNKSGKIWIYISILLLIIIGLVIYFIKKKKQSNFQGYKFTKLLIFFVLTTGAFVLAAGSAQAACHVNSISTDNSQVNSGSYTYVNWDVSGTRIVNPCKLSSDPVGYVNTAWQSAWKTDLNNSWTKTGNLTQNTNIGIKCYGDTAGTEANSCWSYTTVTVCSCSNSGNYCTGTTYADSCGVNRCSGTKTGTCSGQSSHCSGSSYADSCGNYTCTGTGSGTCSNSNNYCTGASYYDSCLVLRCTGTGTGAWTNAGCRINGCTNGQQYQTRTVPSGCGDSTTRCVADSACNLPTCTYTCGSWGACSSSSGTQTRSCPEDHGGSCTGGTPPATSQQCCTVNSYYPDSGSTSSTAIDYNTNTWLNWDTTGVRTTGQACKLTGVTDNGYNTAWQSAVDTTDNNLWTNTGNLTSNTSFGITCWDPLGNTCNKSNVIVYVKAALPTCTYTCGGWGACSSSSGTQTRSCPEDHGGSCTGGTPPATSQQCCTVNSFYPDTTPINYNTNTWLNWETTGVRTNLQSCKLSGPSGTVNTGWQSAWDNTLNDLWTNTNSLTSNTTFGITCWDPLGNTCTGSTSVSVKPKMTISFAGTGGGSVTDSSSNIVGCSTANTTSCNNGGFYPLDTNFTLTASANGTSSFGGWKLYGISPSGTSTLIWTSDAAAMLVNFASSLSGTYVTYIATATFNSTVASLTVQTTGTGAGNITDNLSIFGSGCSNNCTGNFPGGSSFNLTYTPGTNTIFKEWNIYDSNNNKVRGPVTTPTMSNIVLTAGSSYTAKATITNPNVTNSCGDEYCSPEENCSNCQDDCGICTPNGYVLMGTSDQSVIAGMTLFGCTGWGNGSYLGNAGVWYFSSINENGVASCSISGTTASNCSLPQNFNSGKISFNYFGYGGYNALGSWAGTPPWNIPSLLSYNSGTGFDVVDVFGLTPANVDQNWNSKINGWLQTFTNNYPEMGNFLADIHDNIDKFKSTIYPHVSISSTGAITCPDDGTLKCSITGTGAAKVTITVPQVYTVVLAGRYCFVSNSISLIPSIQLPLGGGFKSVSFVYNFNVTNTPQATVVAAKLGTGTGTITDNKGKINCGSTCSATYTPVPTSVIYTATPTDSYNKFVKWSVKDNNGNPATGDGTTTTNLTLNLADGDYRYIYATFDKIVSTCSITTAATPSPVPLANPISTVSWLATDNSTGAVMCNGVSDTSICGCWGERTTKGAGTGTLWNPGGFIASSNSTGVSTGSISASATYRVDCWDNRSSAACNKSQDVLYPACVPDSSCAANTCIGSTCQDACLTVYNGTKNCTRTLTITKTGPAASTPLTLNSNSPATLICGSGCTTASASYAMGTNYNVFLQWDRTKVKPTAFTNCANQTITNSGSSNDSYVNCGVTALNSDTTVSANFVYCACDPTTTANTCTVATGGSKFADDCGNANACEGTKNCTTYALSLTKTGSMATDPSVIMMNANSPSTLTCGGGSTSCNYTYPLGTIYQPFIQWDRTIIQTPTTVTGCANATVTNCIVGNCAYISCNNAALNSNVNVSANFEPVGSCNCNDWANSGACGTGGCPATDKPQIRTCNPVGCDTTNRCATDGSCVCICTPNTCIMPTDCGTSKAQNKTEACGASDCLPLSCGACSGNWKEVSP